VSSVETSFALFTSDCPTSVCDINKHFSLEDSDTLEGPLESNVKTEEAQMYSTIDSGLMIYPNTFTGEVYQDKATFKFE